MRPILFALLLWACAAAGAAPRLLDDLRSAAPWAASASTDVQATLRRAADGALCLDVDFRGVSGYAVMRRVLPMHWPANFELLARLRGEGAVNDVQFKLVDASGDNVWWVNRPNHRLPATLTDWRLRRRQFDFAWGPATDRTLGDTAALELVIAAGRAGGRSSICLARLALLEREPDPATWPEPQVTRQGRDITINLQRLREFDGLALQWPAGARGLHYELLAQGAHGGWRRLRQVRGSDGGLDTLHLPEQEARRLRLRVFRGPLVQPGVSLRSAAQWPDTNALLAEQAGQLPRGDLPRAFLGEQPYWTLVGVDGGGPRSALLSEDGAIELGRGGASVEPVLRVDGGAPVTWAQVQIQHTLRQGHLPLPTVHWAHAQFALQVQAGADGPGESPELLARYVLTNTSPEARHYTLQLVLRPWQVNPPRQFLNTPGGARPVRTLRWQGGQLRLQDGTRLRPDTAPQRVAMLPQDAGLGLAALHAAPTRHALADPQAGASALLQWQVRLAPGERFELGWQAPLGPAGFGTGAIAPRLDAAAAAWQARLTRVQLELPAPLQHWAHSLRSALAHILMSRDGPALQPGTRSYARSWVRDGAMMVAGLLRLGEVQASREFVQWYARHLFASGKVPCCVDARGADPVAENDSHGQFIFSVAELWRHGERTLAGQLWPQVDAAARYMEQLRQATRVPANRAPGREAFWGLMPASISHEGYSAKPMHSYWDNFWALAGWRDAALLARALGHAARATELQAQHDEFAQELAASLRAATAAHRIGFVPGAAELGDFDPTSTSIALHPAGAEPLIGPALLQATWQRAWDEFVARRGGQRHWQDYTPYELRSVAAYARLGQPERALALLDFYFRDQRPAGWNGWAEVVGRLPREPRFLGDLPHAWVASDYIRSVLDLLAYERVPDQALVLGAGLLPEHLQAGPVRLAGLHTPQGPLGYSLRWANQQAELVLDQPAPAPPGGLWWAWRGKLHRWPDGAATMQLP